MQFERRRFNDRNEDCDDDRGSRRLYGDRQEHHEKPCGVGQAAGPQSRQKGSYQQRHSGEVHGTERGEEPAG